jgi:hypothetical protein
VTRPPCALPRRLRPYPQGARIVGHPLRHPHIARIGYRLPLCLPWFWKGGDDANPSGSESPPSPLGSATANATRWEKKPGRLLAGLCRATSKGEN